jgi:hypothetical protein
MLPADPGQMTGTESLGVSCLVQDRHPIAGLLRLGWAVYLLVIRIMSTTDFHSTQNPFERVALVFNVVVENERYSRMSAILTFRRHDAIMSLE